MLPNKERMPDATKIRKSIGRSLDGAIKSRDNLLVYNP